jgi:hypothetical protein
MIFLKVTILEGRFLGKCSLKEDAAHIQRSMEMIDIRLLPATSRLAVGEDRTGESGVAKSSIDRDSRIRTVVVI